MPLPSPRRHAYARDVRRQLVTLNHSTHDR
jgi:hypothetical protein